MMKINILVWSLLVTFFTANCQTNDNQNQENQNQSQDQSIKGPEREGHHIKIKVDGIKNNEVYLAHHFGDKKYMKDTAKVDSKGWAEFKGDDNLPGGIYLFVLPGKKKYFEFVINEQYFTLKTDKENLVDNMTVKNSEENKIFFNYLNFMGERRKKMQKLKQEKQAFKEQSPKKAENIQARIDSMNEEISDKREQIMEEHPNLFYVHVLKAMKEPEVPDKVKNSKDSSAALTYYKDHYFDHLDLSDDRFLRTPIFHRKIKTYVKELTIQQPDSVIKASERLIDLTEGNQETFKYIVNYITYEYERSDIMGMDEVFVHMAENYYLTGQADWVDTSQLKEIKKRVIKLKPNLIGKKAPNLTMNTLEGNSRTLHNIDAKAMVVYFWDSDCGQCQEVTPDLKKIYNKYKDQGVEVYAVNIESERDGWEEYVNNKDLNFINVQDPENKTNFRRFYNIYSTPVVYVLDEDKEIVAKRIAVKQLKEILPKVLKGELSGDSVEDDSKG